MEKATGIELLVQLLIVRFCTAMVVLGALTYVGTMYYTDLEGRDRPEQVMDTRPDAPGTEHAIWEKHQAKCWRFDPKGQTDAALIRIHPNDRFIYTRDAALIERAIDQAVHDNPRGLDRILAFCTDKVIR